MWFNSQKIIPRDNNGESTRKSESTSREDGKIMENVKSVSRKMTAWLYHSFLICPHHVFHCFSFAINLLSSVNSAEHLQMTRVRKASLTNSPGVRAVGRWLQRLEEKQPLRSPAGVPMASDGIHTPD